MPQRTVDFKMARGNEGQLITTAPQVIRGAAEGYYAAEFIFYGAGVVFDSTDTTRTAIALPSGAGQIFAGVAVITQRHGADLEQYMNPESAIFGVPENEAIGLLQVGDVLVWSETPVSRGAGVFLRHTAAAAPNDRPGRWASAGGAGFLDLSGQGLAWNDNTSAPGLARLSLSGNQTRIA